MKIALLLLCSFAAWVGAAVVIVRSKEMGRIIGGSAAVAGQFPFAAYIYKTTSYGYYLCAGTLIKSQWILTAGQCVVDATDFSIRLGTNSMNDDPNSVRLATETYILHPDFNPATLENDVGLIKLRLPVTLTEYIKPIDLLPNTPLPDYSQLITIGWGQTSDNSALSDTLNFAHVTSLSNAECKISYGSIITDNKVCVEGNYNEGACLGDTGGPLIQNVGRSTTYLVGIASFISPNGCDNTDPSGYIRIAPYVEWINGHTSSDCN